MLNIILILFLHCCYPLHHLAVLGFTKGGMHAIFILILFIISLCGDGEKIGVNNGLLGDNLPPQEEVVSLMKNNIGKYRIYKQEPSVFKAFANSGIEIIVGVANFDLQRISSRQEEANKWVNEYIKPYYPATNIKYIAVGNEVLGKPEYANLYVPYLLPAMNNIQMAIRKTNLHDKIKVSTALAAREIVDAMSFQVPSKGTFTDKVKNNVSSVLNFLQHNASPFLANVFPFFIYNSSRESFSLDYALLKPTAPIVKDRYKIYRSLFDAMIDAMYSAMESLGHSNTPIVVTATGWPSRGNDVATISNAQSYNNNLIKHVLSKAGTPKRHGKGIETCIFALFNENQKLGDDTERNFGLFYPNKHPVYPVKFSRG